MIDLRQEGTEYQWGEFVAWEIGHTSTHLIVQTESDPAAHACRRASLPLRDIRIVSRYRSAGDRHTRLVLAMRRGHARFHGLNTKPREPRADER